jgi:hypothetical protein
VQFSSFAEIGGLHHSKAEIMKDSTDPFEQRRIGLEEAFFRQKDQQLLQQMRAELDEIAEKQKLAHVSGIVIDHVLESLLRAGVTAESLTAVSMIPMVEIAWCDGNVAPEERDAVLNGAVAQGIHTGSPSYELLNRWLQERPNREVITAWKEYVRELARVMPKESLAELKHRIMDRCRRVAAAAGGFLGLNTISKHEQAEIDEFSKAFDG